MDCSLAAETSSPRLVETEDSLGIRVFGPKLTIHALDEDVVGWLAGRWQTPWAAGSPVFAVYEAMASPA